MINKLNIIKDSDNCIDYQGFTHNVAGNKALIKINEIIDVIDALVRENNIHEKQIDELQMKDEDLAERINYTLAKVTDDKEALKRIDEKYKPADRFAEQRKWIGKLCRFWDVDNESVVYAILREISESHKYPFVSDCWEGYKHCEPVKPDDDIIYKGGDNE